MDPASIIASALVAGAIAAAKDVTTQAVKDGYAGLKALIIHRFGDKAKLAKAVEQAEKSSATAPRQHGLEEELLAAGAAQDAEVLKQAQTLLDLLQKYGQGAVTTGKKGIAVGGNITGSTIITGDGNVLHINKGPTISAKNGGYLNNVTQITSDAVFQPYTQAPVLSSHIRLREFQSLVEERTQEFIGREFVFKAIEDILQDTDFPSGYIIIHGEPGIGKTALMAQLVKQTGAVHYFNIASQNIRSVRDFLGSVCAQLIVRYDLEHPALPREATRDSGFLSQLLAEVAAKADVTRVVILVDALDESEDIGMAPNTNRLYLPQTIPDSVFFIITTRTKAEYRLLVDRRQDIHLCDDDPHNLEDVRRYILNYLAGYQAQMAPRIQQWDVAEDEFVTIITEKSLGNFMYLVHVLRDIKEGKLSIRNVDDIHKLPQGLVAYYQGHWRAMRVQDIERFEKYYQPVVCIMATVREPVTVEQVSAWTDIAPMNVKEVINAWREFLNVDEVEDNEQRYRVYHTSFQEFLKNEVGLKPYHNIIGQTALNKIKW